MSRLIAFLQHGAWQGINGIVAIFALLFAMWCFHLSNLGSNGIPEPPHAVPHSEAPSPPEIPADSNPDADNILDSSLRSIDERYHGMHQYFNDDLGWAPIAVISVLLFAGSLYSEFWRRRVTHKPK